MIRRFLLWLTARLPVKVIGRDEPYVEWYHVATLPIFGGVRIQLHRFLRSDPDGLHDHPWGWSRSFVLAGWYLEERRDRTRLRRAGTGYGMTGVRECWTLFLHGPYVKHWGFITPIGFVRPGTANGFPDPSWQDWRGGSWLYRARPRSAHRFDPWPRTAPKGRAIRPPEPSCGRCGRRGVRACWQVDCPNHSQEAA